jgi:hypothetical protein
MSIEIGSIASHNKHEQQLGIHPRRRDARSGETLDPGFEDLPEQHRAISP